LQNRLWTADRLRRRGWENCGLWPLCKQTKETNNHLFVHCHFTARIWELLRDWLGIQGIQSQDWGGVWTFNIGGPLWRKDRIIFGRALLPLSCSPCGLFGKRAMIGFFAGNYLQPL
jgi:hypothetical protein